MPIDSSTKLLNGQSPDLNTRNENDDELLKIIMDKFNKNLDRQMTTPTLQAKKKKASVNSTPHLQSAPRIASSLKVSPDMKRKRVETMLGRELKSKVALPVGQSKAGRV